ncbi:MAG: DUF4258 domain-containing protein [Desulfamplus sp.]|nr:DUF4258 domain-containing protein [Desulfamplus sp.]
MIDEESKKELLFEILTPLGFSVRVTHDYWNLISTIKHPVMANKIIEVQETLRDPYEIRLSRKDSAVYLFYRSEHISRWVCAVAKRLNGDGFLITAYPTDSIKEGEQIWLK